MERLVKLIKWFEGKKTTGGAIALLLLYIGYLSGVVTEEQYADGAAFISAYFGLTLIDKARRARS